MIRRKHRRRGADGNERRSAVHASARRELKPGEQAIPYYSHDCAGCSCEASTDLSGVPCISVGRANGRDRCLGCGESWPQMERRGVAA